MAGLGKYFDFLLLNWLSEAAESEIGSARAIPCTKYWTGTADHTWWQAAALPRNDAGDPTTPLHSPQLRKK